MNEQREAGRSEDGIASRLVALKVFSNRFIFKEMELTTCDLLRKVPRISPPERPALVLTEAEREQILSCYDRPTFEDVRNRALVAMYMATGLRFREVLEMPVSSLDRVRGDITVVGKGNRQRQARLSPRALKYVRDYLQVRPQRIATGSGYWRRQSRSATGVASGSCSALGSAAG